MRLRKAVESLWEISSLQAFSARRENVVQRPLPHRSSQSSQSGRLVRFPAHGSLHL